MELEERRVHELADELGYSKNDLVRIINELELGFSVNNFMTQLDGAQVRDVREALEDYEAHRAEAEELEREVSEADTDDVDGVAPDVSPSANGGTRTEESSEPDEDEAADASNERSLKDKYPPGERIRGEIQNITDFGIFVALEEGLNGLVHISDISWTRKIQHPAELYDQGEELDCVVIGLDEEEGKVSLGIKQLEPDPWVTRIPEQYKEGDFVDVTITKLADFGAFAEIEDGITGLIHVSELADRWVDDPAEIVSTGEQHRAEIIKVDPDEREMAFSIKNIDEEPTSTSASSESTSSSPSRYGDVYEEQLGGLDSTPSSPREAEPPSSAAIEPEVRTPEGDVSHPRDSSSGTSTSVESGSNRGATLEEHFRIERGETGHSYQKLFGRYLEGAERVTVEEPELEADYQFEHFQHFCELAAKIDSVRDIVLVTRPEEGEEADVVRDKLQQLGDSLETADIELELESDPHLHDREIRTDTGWKMIVGRGLHIYQKPENRHGIGATDLELRACRQTRVTIFRWPED